MNHDYMTCDICRKRKIPQKVNLKLEMYAVEFTDPHPTLGGKVIKAPFLHRKHAELWARDEVSAAKELGIANLAYRIIKIGRSFELRGRGQSSEERGRSPRSTQRVTKDT